jgi:flagellar hook-associated protein 3 FlgL
MLRVTTTMIYDQGVGAIQRQTAQLLNTQQQVATGRRILTPSHDPVAAARALEVTQAKSVNDQFQLNQGAAKDALGLYENKLAAVEDILIAVRTRAVEAGNGALGRDELGYIATDLRGQFDALLAIANSQDGNGDFMFSGYQGDTRPFSASVGGAVTYAGDQGERSIQVSPSRLLPISNSGDEVFLCIGGASGDMFTMISDFITALEDPAADVAAAASTVIGNMDQALDNTLRVRASVGSRLGEVEALETAGSDLAVQYVQTLSRLQDVDYAQAVSDLTLQQTHLEAAQQSFLRVSQLSLFNYLGS